MEKPSILLPSIVQLKQLQKPEEAQYIYLRRRICVLFYPVKKATFISIWNRAPVSLPPFPEKEEGYDTAEPNEHNKYQDFGHSHWKNSLIWGNRTGEYYDQWSRLNLRQKGLTREESRLPGVGNKAISLKDCRNVTLKDLSMLHCGHFALLATGVDHLTILNLKVDTNRDGFDIDCCRNVRISQCTVNSPWDDAIVLKASYGLGRFQDTEKCDDQ